MKYNPDVVRAYFRTVGIPEPVFELRFHATRNWRFDLAWPEHLVYLEVDGAIWTGGRHARGAGIKKDMEKRNAATALGWRGLWCEPRNLCMNEMAEAIRAALDYSATEK